MSLAAASAAPAGVSAAKPKSRKPFIEARDGTQLFYRDWGQGKPLVFVAPWGLNADWWEYQMTPLSEKGLRCVAFDRRGHGRSEEPSHGYEFDTLSDDLAAVINQLDLRDVTLVGHSMGTAEIVRYLSRHGSQRIARVVLIAPITPFTMQTDTNPNGVPREVLEKLRIPFMTDRPKSIADAAPAFFGPKNPQSAAMTDWWVQQLMQPPMKPLMDLNRVSTETDFTPELRKISVPTLIVQGDNDVSTPLDFTGRRTAALIRGSELKVYEGAAHGLTITHKEQLTQELLSFANR